ncbi:MAG: Yip1 family protein [Candidatus Bathyarchaeia archaeon]
MGKPERADRKNSCWPFYKLIFKVLYAPTKAFEQVVEKPDFKGPILILLITLPIILCGQYISGTKFFLEVASPRNDLWTEKSDTPLFSWDSSNDIVLDGEDYIVGNYSVSTSLANSSLVWTYLTDIGDYNCSEEEYSRLSFRAKWVNEDNVAPINAILRLFSFNDGSRKFELDIREILANRTDVWANITVNLVTANWRLTPENPQSWTNVTGIGFQLEWEVPANITLKIDDLFFGKYTPILFSDIFEIQLLYSLMRNSVNFLLEWFILSGIVYLALKSFSDWKGMWKNLLYVIGYIFSPSIVYVGALALLFLFLPPFFVPRNITYLEYVSLYQSSWGMPISVLNLLSYLWSTVLCVIALKSMHELSWSKAFLISFVAVVMTLVFGSIVLSMFSL